MPPSGPATPKDPACRWVEVCTIDALPPGERKLIKIENVEIALFNIDGTIFAIKNRCPHRSGPLIRGYIDSERGIKCPMHGWRFDLRTGESQRPAHATVYQVKIEGGDVYTEVPSL